MTFEEQFPNLDGGDTFVNPHYDEDWVHKKDIIKNCLDKQKVKEAIEKTLKNCYDDEEWQDKKHLFSELEKELDL